MIEPALRERLQAWLRSHHGDAAAAWSWHTPEGHLHVALSCGPAAPTHYELYEDPSPELARVLGVPGTWHHLERELPEEAARIVREAELVWRR
jgi:hypothetical protein